MTSTLTNNQAWPMCGWFLGVRPQTYIVTASAAGWNGSLRPVRVLKSSIGKGILGLGSRVLGLGSASPSRSTALDSCEARFEVLDALQQTLNVLLLRIGHVDPVQIGGAV